MLKDEVDPSSFDRSPRPILRKLLGTKELKLVYDGDGAHVFDERDPAVNPDREESGPEDRALRPAPSDYPAFADFLVEQGIDSISLNADAILRTTLRVLEKESTLGVGPSTSR